ncbi:MAG: tyrosine-type recombinase/integrase [Faecalibacterium sp.]
MPKRGLNIYKRKDGRWEARYIKGRNKNGKPIWGYLYASTYRDAKAALEQTRFSKSEQTVSDKELRDSHMFETIAQEWLASISNSCKESTCVRYQNLLQAYWEPRFKSIAVEQITKQMVEDACKSLSVRGKKQGGGLSGKTISDALSVLRRVLSYAQSQEVHVESDIFRVSVRQPVKPLRILSLSEQHILQEYLCSRRDPMHLGILLCMFTGIRIGELCALTWDDISLESRMIHVQKTMQRIQHKKKAEEYPSKTYITVTSPKSSCSDRMIPISEELKKLIDSYPLQHIGYFLSGSDAKIIEPRVIQYQFKIALESCGIPPTNFHVLRHTFATRCVEAEIDIKTLSEILGHSSVNITMNRYVHPSMELKRKSMNQLAEFMSVK